METFPASDPIAVHPEPDDDDERMDRAEGELPGQRSGRARAAFQEIGT